MKEFEKLQSILVTIKDELMVWNDLGLDVTQMNDWEWDEFLKGNGFYLDESTRRKLSQMMTIWFK